MADNGGNGKVIVLRFAGKCHACQAEIPARSRAYYESQSKIFTCLSCGEPPGSMTQSSTAGTATDLPKRPGQVASARGVAGASARREYEKRAARHQEREEQRIADDARWRAEAVREHPILGRIAAAATPRPTIRPEPQNVRAWDVGARGEETLSKLLNGWANGSERQVLHDRRIPGTRANIDHIAVAANGVWAIDAKNYGGLVESQDVGGWFRTDLRLRVGGRDRSKLLEGLAWQISTIEEAIRAATGEHAVPVHGILCFIDADWRWFAKPPRFGSNIYVAWPSASLALLNAEGYLAEREVMSVADLLTNRFHPA